MHKYNESNTIQPNNPISKNDSGNINTFTKYELSVIFLTSIYDVLSLIIGLYIKNIIRNITKIQNTNFLFNKNSISIFFIVFFLFFFLMLNLLLYTKLVVEL